MACVPEYSEEALLAFERLKLDPSDDNLFKIKNLRYDVFKVVVVGPGLCNEYPNETVMVKFKSAAQFPELDGGKEVLISDLRFPCEHCGSMVALREECKICYPRVKSAMKLGRDAMRMKKERKERKKKAATRIQAVVRGLLTRTARRRRRKSGRRRRRGHPAKKANRKSKWEKRTQGELVYKVGREVYDGSKMLMTKTKPFLIP